MDDNLRLAIYEVIGGAICGALSVVAVWLWVPATNETLSGIIGGGAALIGITIGGVLALRRA